MPGRAAFACRGSGDIPDHESASIRSLFFPNRLSEHVFEGRHARAKMPHLSARRRRERKQVASAPLSRHKDAHDVFVGGMTFQTGGRQMCEKRLQTTRWRLNAQLE